MKKVLSWWPTSATLVMWSLLSAALLVPAAGLRAKTLRVPTDYPLIQDAIAAAFDGDEVVIAPGTYYEHGISFLGKAIRVRGVSPTDPDTVVIDAGGLGGGFVFEHGEGPFSILAGLTVTGGVAEQGGGIRIAGANPGIEHVTLKENEAQSGGGLSCEAEDPPPAAEKVLVLWHVVVTDNRATGSAGISGHGGGIYARGCELMMHGSRITGNSAAGSGGGLYLWGPGTSAAVIFDTTIESNQAFWGGGVYSLEAAVELYRVHVTGNVAAQGGGGVAVDDGALALNDSFVDSNAATAGPGGGVLATLDASFDAENCVINGNSAGLRGGGLAAYGSSVVDLQQSTVAGNQAVQGGGAIYCTKSAAVSVASSILWNSSTPEISADAATVSVTLSDVRGGWPGGNLDVDPLFGEDGFDLTERSPVRNRIEYVDTRPRWDVDGQARPWDRAGDMGADEYYGPARSLPVPSEKFSTIQSAIDAARHGDEVVVAPGRYREHDIDFRGKQIMVRSADPLNPAIVDAGNLGRVFSVQIGRLKDLTISGGTASPPGRGGGVFCGEGAPPQSKYYRPLPSKHPLFAIIENCTVERNRAFRGGGVYCWETGEVRGGTIRGNSADSSGGGVVARIVTGATIEGNKAMVGGGVHQSRVIDSTVRNNGSTLSASRGGGIANPYWVEDTLIEGIEGTLIEGNRAAEGGGIWADQSPAPVVRDAVIRANTAGDGGGVYGNLSLLFDEISDNKAARGGGVSLYGSSPSVRGGEIRGNHAEEEGGGIWAGSQPAADVGVTVAGADVRGNRAARGGGLYLDEEGTATVTVKGCTIRDNSADELGGGVFSQGHGQVRESTFAGNSALAPDPEFGCGGGFYCAAGAPLLSNATFFANTALEGGGLFAEDACTLTLRNSTLTANQALARGAAMLCTSTATDTRITHSIFWGNVPDEIVAFRGCGEQVKYSDVRGGWPGAGNVDVDPQFVAPESGDFHLQEISLCIDSGTNADTAAIDVDNEPRPFGDSVDMGSDEARWLWYQPNVEAVEPHRGLNAGGEIVRLTGTHFGGYSKVFFGERQAEVVAASETSLDVVTPVWPGTGFANVKVDNGTDPDTGMDYRDVLTNGFEFVELFAPVLNAVEPDTGAAGGGDQVRVLGNHFRDPMRVFFGAVEAAAVEYVSAEELRLFTPAAPGACLVDVTVVAQDGGSATLADGFRYVPESAPQLDGLAPATGLVGVATAVDLNGHDFEPPLQVFFGQVKGEEVTVVSRELVKVVAPTSFTEGKVDVVIRDKCGQEAILAAGFEYVLPSPPVLTELQPASGTNNGGDSVVISGKDFTDPMTVLFDGVKVSDVTFVSDAKLEIVTPASPQAGSVAVTVRDAFDQTSNALTFSYTGAADPAIDSVDPAEGSTGGGQVVTISGSGFAPGVRLVLRDVVGQGEIEVPVQLRSSAELTFITPSHISGVGCSAAAVEVIVTNPNGAGASGSFTFIPAQTLHISPGESIQAAIDAAVRGACILLAANEYPGYVENLDFGDKVISMYGELPDEPTRTTIVARVPQLPVVRYTSNRGSGTLLRGVALLLGNGGIVCEGSSPRLENLVIQNNNRDQSGGGIAVLEGSAPTVKDVTVASNTTGGNGGGVYVDEASQADFRGEIKVVSNHATEGAGGGLWLPAGSILELAGATFKSNDAGSSGGGIYVSGASKFDISASSVAGNAAGSDGGGVYVAGDSDVTISDSTVDDNAASEDGGGLWVGPRGTVRIAGTSGVGSFSGNTAGQDGAGIYFADAVNAQIEAVTLANNDGLSDISKGGGLFAGDFFSGWIRDCRIVGNEAQIGGGLFLKFKSTATIERNEVACNEVWQHNPIEPQPVFAPGIYSADSLSSFFNNTVVNNTFKDKDATETTGGLHIDDPFMFPVVVNNLFDGNKDYGLVCSGAELMGRISHNLFFGNVKGAAFGCGTGINPVVNQDPLLVSPACPNPDLHLGAGSPAIGKGEGGVDIGAHQFEPLTGRRRRR